MPALLPSFLSLALVLVIQSYLLHQRVSAQETSQPNVCLRWAHQSTVARSQAGGSGNGNGPSVGRTMWIYGGRARTSIGQAENSEWHLLIAGRVSSRRDGACLLGFLEGQWGVMPSFHHTDPSHFCFMLFPSFHDSLSPD